MLFKKKKAQFVPPTPMDNTASFKSDPVSEKDTAAESKVKDVQGIQTATDIVYPSGLKLVLLMISIFVGLFLVALDKLIISTAIPQITNEFHSADDIGWYGTAFLLSNCAFLLVFGKLYTIFNVKYTFLAAVFLFEVGSAVCGSAPNSIAFIIGRAISGLGAGGVQSGILVIIVYAVPLHRRPKYQGFFGAVFGIASVLGPLLGGVFTTKVTWRWCFYINLPFGGMMMVFVFFLLHIPARPNTMTLKQKVEQLNIWGLIALLPGVVCLCLALQWGGFTYKACFEPGVDSKWSDGRIIALLVVAFILLIVFILIQIWKPEQATVPPRIFIQRSIFSGFWASFFFGAHQTMFIYYLPVWFQAIKGNSAVESGIHLLPMVLAIVVASIFTGISTSRIGYYAPFLIFGISISAIGAGLLYTIGLNTTVGQWIGYQILYGFGLGCSAQAPNMAAQTVLPRHEVSIGASLMLFALTLSGSIFVSIGQNVLDGRLIQRLTAIAPNLTPQQIENAGATGLYDIIPAAQVVASKQAYNDSLRLCFQVALIMACLSILGGVGMEWRSVKKDKETPPAANIRGEKAFVEEGKSQSDAGDKELKEADSNAESVHTSEANKEKEV